MPLVKVSTLCCCLYHLVYHRLRCWSVPHCCSSSLSLLLLFVFENVWWWSVHLVVSLERLPGRWFVIARHCTAFALLYSPNDPFRDSAACVLRCHWSSLSPLLLLVFGNMWWWIVHLVLPLKWSPGRQCKISRHRTTFALLYSPNDPFIFSLIVCVWFCLLEVLRWDSKCHTIGHRGLMLDDIYHPNGQPFYYVSIRHSLLSPHCLHQLYG